MACVFQLGPKTKFGESEQNPAYWLQLLLLAKEPGATVTWYDPVTDCTSERELHGDVRYVRHLSSIRWCKECPVARFLHEFNKCIAFFLRTDYGFVSFCRS